MTKARDLANASTALGAVSATELGYVDGVTSAIQTQLDAKTAKSTLTTTGDIYYASGANTPARLGIGSTGNVLTVASGIPSWAAPAGGSSTFVGCKVFIGAAQSIANATLVTVTYSDEAFDTDGFHSTSSNTDRITIPSGKAGYYLVNWTVNFADNATGYRTSQVSKNGSRIGYGNWTDAISGDPTVTSNSVILNLAAGDYLTIQVAQTSSASLNLSVSAPVAQQDNNFSVTYLGA